MDHTENTLRGVVKALTDVIAPAIDPTDAPANEQLRLSIDYLQFLRARLNLLYGRERFELGHHLAMARALDPLPQTCPAAIRDALASAIRAGFAAEVQIGAGIPVLRAATADLAVAIRTLIRAAADFEEPVRRRLESVVIEATEDRIAFERAWYLPLGFDPAPNEVKSAAEFLARAEQEVGSS